MSLTYKLERGKKHNEDGITLARNRTGKGGLEAERVGYYMLLLLLHLKSKVSTCLRTSSQAMQGENGHTLVVSWRLHCAAQFSAGPTVSMTLVVRQRCELCACHEWTSTNTKLASKPANSPS